MAFSGMTRRKFLQMVGQGTAITTVSGAYKVLNTLIGVSSANATECNEDCIIYDGNNAGTVGTTIFHPANENIVYDWFSYVPSSIKKEEKSYVLVYSTGGLSDYNQNTEAIKSVTLFLQERAELHKFILLLPSIPNSPDEPYIYTIAMDKRVFYDTTDEFRKRPDIKVNQMIDSLTNDLTKVGYDVHEKVFFEGFSAGGMFVQRYTLLHPERVQAIGGGQCGGFLTLPVSTYQGTVLDWAIGVNDFESLVGYDFNQEVYKQVPQLIYIGDQDIGDEYNHHSHFLYPNPEGFWTQEQIDFINNIFGDTDPVRVENECKYLKDLGYNVKFNLYLGYDHGIMPWSTPEIYDDVFAFHDSHKESSHKVEDKKTLPFLPLLLFEK